MHLNYCGRNIVTGIAKGVFIILGFEMVIWVIVSKPVLLVAGGCHSNCKIYNYILNPQRVLIDGRDSNQLSR